VVSSYAILPSPLDLLELPFLRSALLELLLLAPAAGLLGAFVVLRRLAFFAHATGSASFPALVAAEAAGVGTGLAGLAAGLGFAGAVARRDARSGRAGGGPASSTVALVLVGALALGVVLASDVLDVGSAVDSLLFGTLLGLTGFDLALAGAATLLAAAGTLLAGRLWLASGFDPEAARASGLPAAAGDALLLALVATAVAAAIPAVGALLVASLFVVPAAVARPLAGSVPWLLALSVLVAVATAVAGLYAAWALDVPPGPAIALLGALAFAASATAARGRPG